MDPPDDKNVEEKRNGSFRFKNEEYNDGAELPHNNAASMDNSCPKEFAAKQRFQNLTRAEFTSYDLYQRHILLMDKMKLSQLLQPPQKRLKSDYEVLKDHHQFLRDSTETGNSSWETKLSIQYYNKLYKEYVISDLSYYKTGKVGFRWRTEREVIQGKGQFWCGSKGCNSKKDIRSYEVNFKYHEQGQTKQALVKARLCVKCAYKLHYKHMKSWKKQRRRERRDPMQAHQRAGELEIDAHIGHTKRGAVEMGKAGLGLESDSTSSKLPEESQETAADAALVAKELERFLWKEPLESEVKDKNSEFDEFFKELFL